MKIFSVVVIIFITINVFALFLIRQIDQKTYLDESINHVYTGFNNRTRKTSADRALHPVLHFASTPIRSEGWNVGIEGIRYFSDDWTDDYVRDLLLNKETIFAMGSSITFGSGVLDNETWPYHLDGLTDLHCINFGCDAYDQYRLIDKLLYLLKKGYRPKKVIFMTGLNDSFSLIYANYNIYDHYNKYGFFINRRESVTYSNICYSWRDALRALPVVAYWQRRNKNLDFDKIQMEKDGNMDKFDFFEAEFVARNPLTFYKRDPEYFHQKLLSYYKSNVRFLDRLSEAFGFKYYIFFQPTGYLDERNPAIDFEKFKETDTYAFISESHNFVKKNIKDEVLNFYDISEIFAEEEGIYADISHYNSKGYKILAGAIMENISGDE